MSTKTLHLVANAHLDPVWLWRWPEGCAEIRATCRAAADFLARDKTLRFCRSSAGDLSWLLAIESGLLRRMRKLVQDGRWENVGGWITQPDCNLPAGESFVRQALYGQDFFRRRLGAAAVTGYNVDSFGHHANLPQLLRQCGLRYYVFMRPGPQENAQIPAGYFHWEGVDGTRVLAYHVFDPYNANEGWGLRQTIDTCRQILQTTEAGSLMVFYDMGDHGGGPTRAALKLLGQWQKEPGMPALVQATPREAFAAAEAEGRDFPVYRGEMQIHAAGCYAAHSEVKRLNRRGEEALLAAERLSVLAHLTLGRRLPTQRLAAAWRDLLFCQFHDVLAGSSVREAYADARDQMGRAA
jgi:alpha-mannosidase